jgi:hypothetical protein
MLKCHEKRVKMTAYLRDTALHDYKVGIVDVELDRLKECLNILLEGLVTIQKILGDIR